MGVLTGLDRVPAAEARALARDPDRLKVLFGYEAGDLGFTKGPHLGLDKAWDELGPLLSSTGFEKARNELGMYRPTRGFDDYGWARYVTATDVRKVAAALGKVDLARVRANRAEARGYEGLLEESGLFDYAVGVLEETIVFFRGAAEAGDAVFLLSA